MDVGVHVTVMNAAWTQSFLETWHGHRYRYQEIRETWREHGLAHDS